MTGRVSDTFPEAGLDADRPAAGVSVPQFYSAIDTGVVWRWDGTTWSVWALALPDGGTDGYVPKWDNTAGLWVPGAETGGGGTGPTNHCVVLNNAATSIPNSTQTLIPFTIEDYDPVGMHDVATNNTRVTILTSGLYRVEGTVAFTYHATGFRSAILFKNGATQIADAMTLPNNAGNSVAVTTLVLAAGDYLELKAFQSSGGALTLLAGSFNRLAVVQIA